MTAVSCSSSSALRTAHRVSVSNAVSCSAESLLRNAERTSPSSARIFSSVMFVRSIVKREAEASSSIFPTCSGVRLLKSRERVSSSRSAAADANSFRSSFASSPIIPANSFPLSLLSSSLSVKIKSLSSMTASHCARSSSGTSERIFLSSLAILTSSLKEANPTCPVDRSTSSAYFGSRSITSVIQALCRFISLSLFCSAMYSCFIFALLAILCQRLMKSVVMVTESPSHRNRYGLSSVPSVSSSGSSLAGLASAFSVFL